MQAHTDSWLRVAHRYAFFDAFVDPKVRTVVDQVISEVLE